ncbi:hypothetical protein [Nocardioides caldifontis]|uniref:hypothetical protein n=1 Tax=Nocardioides caldifontis TaxID=2588938 RepID=UPI0011DF2504|nr:hypothetical protein [Nocardioides caldifontis]
MHRLEEAVARLDSAVSRPVTPGRPPDLSWRELVRARLGEVYQELSEERADAPDGWLEARAGHLLRERNRLLAKVSVIHPMVDSADAESVRATVGRLVQDLEHHHQRVSDLLYDGVAMEVGGSE